MAGSPDARCSLPTVQRASRHTYRLPTGEGNGTHDIDRSTAVGHAFVSFPDVKVPTTIVA